MIAANVYQTRRAGEKRQKADKQRREKRQQRDEEHRAMQNRDSMMNCYGKSQPGQLGHDELKELLTDKAGGKDIRDTDVDYYLKRFGKANGESKDVITQKELGSLLKSFSRYANVMDTTANILTRYDRTNKGALNRDEVQQWMEDTAGRDVTHKEVDTVMKYADASHTGQIEAPEISDAAVWWSHARHPHQQEQCCFCQ